MGDCQNEVLVVEDDTDLREVYGRALSTTYAVSTAVDGSEALDSITDDTDVVLLDRRLPDTDADALVRELTNECRDASMALVTAVEPDFDIIQLGIDDYLVKPVTPDQLQDTIDRLLSLAEYDALYRELSQKRVKRSVLAQEKTPTELRESDEFERLCHDIERLESDLDDIAETIGETPRGLEH